MRSLACGHDPSGDFVSQDEWKRMPRRNAVVNESNVRVTDATARYFHNHFFWTRFERGKFTTLQSSFRGLQFESNCASDARHCAPLPLERKEGPLSFRKFSAIVLSQMPALGPKTLLISPSRRLQVVNQLPSCQWSRTAPAQQARKALSVQFCK
jgi:hypothetical protein